MSGLVYYNEFDPKAAAWLRELIRRGLIADGVVDERSICDVRASELRQYRQCHFFAGIGGWSRAFRLAGISDDEEADSGSCPCQPFSDAGKGAGEADPRHLWPAWFNIIRERRPAAIYGEQVASKAALKWWDGVSADLESEGYAAVAFDLCSAGLGAPTIRQRLFWVAFAQGQGRQGMEPERAEGLCERARIGSDRAIRRLACPDGRQPCNGSLQRGGEHGQQPQDGGAGGVEYASGNGRQQRRSESGGRSIASGCEHGLIVPRGSGFVVPFERMGDLHDPRSQGFVECGDGSGQRPSGSPGVGGGFWDRFDLCLCTDGKARRIEPGAFPLASRIPARVGLLRGYGNAINVEVAAEFIRASREAAVL